MGQFFTNSELRPWLASRLDSAIARVDAFDKEQVKFSPEAVATAVAADFAIDPVGLDWSQMRAAEPREVKIPWRQFGNEVFADGHSVSIFIPLVGPSDVLRMRAGQGWLGEYPDVDQVGNELKFTIEHTDLTPELVDSSVTKLRERLEMACAWVNEDTSAWNARLPTFLAREAAHRKEVLDRTDKISAGLTIPIRKSPTAPEIVPVRPRTAVAPKAVDGKTQAADPALEDSVYQQIVETIRTVGNTAERLPATAAKFHEEEWRDLLLFILNATFEGAVLGEVFNGAGKTDLLLRFKDKNAFIGECKFWSGEKAFGDAIDQLLGYTVWRDSKAALILFIRNKDATSVIEKADSAIRGHTSFISAKPSAAPDSRRDYLVHALNDAERRISLAFLPIVVPRRAGEDESAKSTS